MTFVTPAVLPPTVVTGTALYVTGTSALLTGTVSPNGPATVAQFQYGLDTTYGSVATAQSTTSSTATHTVEASISGLAPSTTYHYRLTGSNANGVADGNDMTFVTAALTPPAVTTGTAINITGTSAVLTATVNPNGPTTEAQFQYGLDTTYGNLTPAQPIRSGTTKVTLAAEIAGLSPATVYHFRVTGSNANGSATGEDMTFETASSAAPMVITGSANNIEGGSVTLNGTVNPNGGATGAFFQYGTSLNYGKATQAQAVGSGTAAVPVLANISGLSPGIVYHFRLTATNALGIAYGNDMTFNTLTTPIATTGAATDLEPTSAMLNGSVNPDGSATTTMFEYGLTTAYGSETTPMPLATESPQYVGAPISALVSGTIYHFRLDAINASGTTYGNDVTFVTPVPLLPVVITYPATATGTTTVTLNAIVNPRGADTAVSFQYGLDTNYGSVAPAPPIDAGSGTRSKLVSAQVANLQPATTYHFRAVADGAGMVTGSDQTFTTQFPFGIYAGRYGALIVGVTNTDSGLTMISVTNQGSYTASVRIGRTDYAFGGRVSQSGTAAGRTSGLILNLALSATGGTPQVAGTLDGALQTSFTAEPLFTGTMPAATYTTYMLPPSDPSLPQGDGYGILRASTGGGIYLAGRLGDDHAFTASGALLMDGTTALLYGTVSKGSIEIVLGNVLFTSSNGEVNAALAWVKPQTTGTYTPAPIATTVNLAGSAYAAPIDGPAITSTTGDIEFADGNLATSPLDIPVTLSNSNKIVLGSTKSDGLTITISPSDGLFTGAFYDPTAHALRHFEGVLLQGDLQFGAGVFKGATEAGSVTLFPQP
jgi:phosphodiesterase/alkaline phosphatase D-like protein